MKETVTGYDGVDRTAVGDSGAVGTGAWEWDFKDGGRWVGLVLWGCEWEIVGG